MKGLECDPLQRLVPSTGDGCCDVDALDEASPSSSRPVSRMLDSEKHRENVGIVKNSMRGRLLASGVTESGT